MAAFTPKNYQQAVLDSIEHYLRACQQEGDANKAFYASTLELWGKGSAYNPIAGFAPDMPYFCLRVPTGGGKTWLAAKAVSLVNRHLLRSEHSLILWLVPSTPSANKPSKRSGNRSTLTTKPCAKPDRLPCSIWKKPKMSRVPRWILRLR